MDLNRVRLAEVNSKTQTRMDRSVFAVSYIEGRAS